MVALQLLVVPVLPWSITGTILVTHTLKAPTEVGVLPVAPSPPRAGAPQQPTARLPVAQCCRGAGTGSMRGVGRMAGGGATARLIVRALAVAMVAGVAFHLHAAGRVGDLTLDAIPTAKRDPRGRTN